MNARALVAACGLMMMVGCSSKDADECQATWTAGLADGAVGSAKVEGGALVMRLQPDKYFDYTLRMGAGVGVTQPDLVGDFKVTLTFEGYEPGVSVDSTYGPALVLQLRDAAVPAEYANMAGAVYLRLGHRHARLQTNQLVPEEAVASDIDTDGPGVIVLERSGQSLTATLSIGGVTKSLTTTRMLDKPVSLFVGLANPQTAGTTKQDKEQSIRIKSFAIDGVRSDTFTCNSVR